MRDPKIQTALAAMQRQQVTASLSISLARVLSLSLSHTHTHARSLSLSYAAFHISMLDPFLPCSPAGGWYPPCMTCVYINLPLSSERGAYKTFQARFWFWLSGECPSIL